MGGNTVVRGRLEHMGSVCSCEVFGSVMPVFGCAIFGCAMALQRLFALHAYAVGVHGAGLTLATGVALMHAFAILTILPSRAPTHTRVLLRVLDGAVEGLDPPLEDQVGRRVLFYINAFRDPVHGWSQLGQVCRLGRGQGQACAYPALIIDRVDPQTLPVFMLSYRPTTTTRTCRSTCCWTSCVPAWLRRLLSSRRWRR